MADPVPEHDPRVYFAAERTFLAWIRTGIGLMGVGFAVARFGLFLREIHAGSSVPTLGVSTWSGVALVLLGVAVNVYATVRHLNLTHALRSGTWIPGQVSKGAIALALLLTAVGLAMALYLLIVR